MKKIKISILVVGCLVFLTTGKSFGYIPTPSHVVVVVLENHGYGSIAGSSAAPYINSLINDPNCAFFTQSYALAHPSQPNYLQLFSGSTQGCVDDAIPAGVPFTTPNLGAELLHDSKPFIGYSESLPSVGYLGGVYGSYAAKHSPWTNWQGTGLNQLPATCNQPFTAFPTDYNLLPTVSFVIPNQDNDMHNGIDPLRITTGDTWVQTNLNSYIQWAKTNNSLLIITFDEDEYMSSQRIVTMMIGSHVQGGTYANPIDHYSVLSLLEDMYNLPNSGAAANAGPIDYCWTTCNQMNVSIAPVAPVTICAGSSVTLTASGASSYTWMPGNMQGSNITVSPTATTTYSVTGADTSGCVRTTSRQVIVSTAVPAIPAAISGNSTICANNANVTYTVSAVANVVYNWTAPSGMTIVSGQGTNSIVCNFGSTWVSGTLSVTGSNGCGAGVARTLALRSVLNAPSSITGSAYQCGNTTTSFSCPAVAGATGYIWGITGDATGINNGNSATVTFGPTFTTGVLSVLMTNMCGNSATRTLTLKNFVTTPVAITGITTGLCPSGIATTSYSVAAVAGAVSYLWTLPTGASGSSTTNTISVTFGTTFTSGNITCAAVSVCGIASAPRTLALKSVLAAPAGITGLASGLCNLNGVIYTCTTVAGATSYTWTVPTGGSIVLGQGTSSVTVNFGTITSGSVTVKANNACGSSPLKTLTVKGAPATPVAITGIAGVCANQQGVNYSTGVIANASSYTWTVPTGAVIVSGQTTTAIVANFGGSAGNVTVKANNACGSSSLKTLATTIICIDAINDNGQRSLTNEEENGMRLNVYSNSGEKVLKMQLFLNEETEVTVEIYDVLGNKLMESKEFLKEGENILQAGVEGFARGIYMVRVVSAGLQEVKNRKVIIN